MNWLNSCLLSAEELSASKVVASWRAGWQRGSMSDFWTRRLVGEVEGAGVVGASVGASVGERVVGASVGASVVVVVVVVVVVAAMVPHSAARLLVVVVVISTSSLAKASMSTGVYSSSAVVV
mmetsp:Transcript_5075/g.7920  ORF Transcript_5075/g.7920 Transcript_5075/m.7920 type:complete len:122 (+) Transcript_5075:1106-1471(+)